MRTLLGLCLALSLGCGGKKAAASAAPYAAEPHMARETGPFVPLPNAQIATSPDLDLTEDQVAVCIILVTEPQVFCMPPEEFQVRFGGR